MPNHRLDIEYDGTDLSGWQIQTNARTVQEDLQKSLSTLLRENVHVIGAGRTDAGVHAIGQVANFFTASEIDIPKVHHSLNAMLAGDIVVKALLRAADDFHARYSAKYRQYSYRISTRKAALGRMYKWHLCYKVDWKNVKLLLPLIEGSHDFTAFCASGSETENRVCNIHFFCVDEKEEDIFLIVRADRFLYKMVRSLVGTMVDIGRGYLPAENLQQALQTGNRSLIGDTAPARGLTLVEVGY